MKKDIKKIAIVRLSALGDIINSAVVLQFIKKHYPTLHVEWITEEIFASILDDVKYLDTIHTINLKKFKKEKNFPLLKATYNKLKMLGEYDLIIDMQGLLKSALVAKTLGKHTHGFDKNSIREPLASLFYTTNSNISYEKSVILRNLHVVGDALDFYIDESMLLDKESLFTCKHHFILQQEKKNIALIIGASWSSKIYPKEKLVEVCNALNAHCHIVWGNEKEKEDALFIATHTTNATPTQKLSLSELVSFISHMNLLIGNDTGPTHIAWAQNIPSITLFGPTNERMIYQTPKNIAINSPSHVNILKINKQDFSIKEINPQTIITKAKELLDYGI
jgi:heptosyltransferase-1